VTGASGAIYAVRTLERLHNAGVETHLVVSRAAEKTLFLETGMYVAALKERAHTTYAYEDIAARLASGSFRTDGMLVVPCSMNTLGSIAAGLSSNLLLRAADVVLKERRRLVLMVRETPFHLGHLRSMVAVTEMGAIVAPPIPAFYTNPQTVMDIVDHSVDRALDLLNVEDAQIRRWDGAGAKQ
jgi:4-hydroxy-3-polyprenylbenzoate decarboxylase